MDLEQIVQQILLVRRDISREEILKRIYERKRSTGDYILDDVAARIVAAELGVEIPHGDEALAEEIPIRDIVSGLNDVTVIGRIIIVHPVQNFRRADLTEGKVGRMRIADKTGSLNIVLWNDKVNLLEDGGLRQGEIVKVRHGYVREGLDGKLELHVGQRGNVQVSPPNVDEADFPRITDFIEKIGRLTTRNRRANVAGLIRKVYPPSEFKRKDGTGGKVRRLRLEDETGEVTVVFWNKKVDELAEVNSGDPLQIMNARVKEKLGGGLELHVENSAQIEKHIQQDTKLPARRKELLGISALNTSMKGAAGVFAVSQGQTDHRIVDIKEKGGPFVIEGTVVTKPTLREVTTRRNEKVRVASFDIADSTGRIRVNLWRKLAEAAENLKVGTRVRMTNIYAIKGFSNHLEFVSRTSTTLESLPESKPTQTRLTNRMEKVHKRTLN